MTAAHESDRFALLQKWAADALPLSGWFHRWPMKVLVLVRNAHALGRGSRAVFDDARFAPPFDAPPGAVRRMLADDPALGDVVRAVAHALSAEERACFEFAYGFSCLARAQHERGDHAAARDAFCPFCRGAL